MLDTAGRFLSYVTVQNYCAWTTALPAAGSWQVPATKRPVPGTESPPIPAPSGPIRTAISPMLILPVLLFTVILDLDHIYCFSIAHNIWHIPKDKRKLSTMRKEVKIPVYTISLC